MPSRHAHANAYFPQLEAAAAMMVCTPCWTDIHWWSTKLVEWVVTQATYFLWLSHVPPL